MKITDLSVNRNIASIMLFVGVIVLGFVSYSKMPLDLFPDIEFPVAVVITEYPEVGPKEIESTITRPMEEAVAGINNVESVTSRSDEGISIVMVKFVWGTDMALGVSDIREKVDIIKGFYPDGVETPVVLKFDMSMMPIMVLAVSGERDISRIREYSEDTLKNLLEQVDGVASAGIRGGYKNEVKVELVRNRMEAYGISIDQVVNILRMENMNVAGGDVKTPKRKYTLRTQGEFRALKDIENIVITVKSRTPVYLKDIARVYMGQAEKKEIVRLNGSNGVVVLIYKQSDKNTVRVAQKVQDRIEEIRGTLPPGLEISTFFNSADYIEKSIFNVIKNALQGGLIAVLVVFVFLRNIRSALILGLSIPISIIATFIAMYYFDLSLNMMSMGGLALGVGMLIDNSIVILENIFRFRERGARPGEAARLGADEMAMAITASTLTTISVFVPFFFTEGLAGQLFKEMALTISFSLLCSLLIALTLIPMMTSRYIKRTRNVYSGRLAFINTFLNHSEEYFNRLEDFYGRAITWALAHRGRVVLYTLGAIVVGILLLPLTGMEFMPEQDRNQITIIAELPVGTNLDTTEESMKLIEKRVLATLRDDELHALSIRAGSGEGFAAAFGDTKEHSGKIEMRLTAQTDRKRSEQEIRRALREAFGDIPGVTFNFNPQTDQSGMSGGADISIEIYGYDFEDSRNYTGEIMRAIGDVEGLKDIDLSREEGLPEKVIVVNREKASKIGLNAMAVASMIKNNVSGITATTYRKKGKEYDIEVRMRESDRRTVNDIKRLSIMTPLQRQVPIGSLIDVKTSSGPVSIERKKQERVAYINCKAEGRDLNSVVRDIQSRIKRLVKPTNFHVKIGGAFEDMQDTFKDLALALLLAVVLIYIIMSAQFESLWSPFIIMFTVPTIVFGVMVFLFLTGTTFNVITFMGILMLSGIVVNNAIVYVDYTNILRARGSSLYDALVEAGKKRLRPILMTTFTTILALVPMSLGIGEGSELTAPLARAVIGGLSSSFIFTLIFLPVVYSLLESLRDRIQGRRSQS